MSNIEIKVSTSANRKWMLHEHHGWTCLAECYGTRAEYDEACAAEIMNAAEHSDSSPALFNRAEFLECDYYERHHADIAADTTYIVATGRDDIAEFTSQEAAEKALDEAMREHGYDRLTCDRGGHASSTEHTTVSDIRVTVTAPSGIYRFDFDGADAEVTDEMLEDKDVPQSEREDVRQAVECELADIAAE